MLQTLAPACTRREALKLALATVAAAPCVLLAAQSSAASPAQARVDPLPPAPGMSAELHLPSDG